MSLPLLGYLAAAGDTTLHILARPYIARVYQGSEAAGDIIVSDTAGTLSSVQRNGALLRPLGLGAAAILPASFSSALIAWLGRVPNRVGYAHDGRAVLLSSALSTKQLRARHLSESYLDIGRDILGRVGLSQPADYASPQLRVYEGDCTGLDAVLNQVGAPVAGFAVVVPGATYGPTKKWPTERYAQLVARLSADIPVIISGAPRESELCESVRGGNANVYNIAGMTSLGQLFALLERAQLVIANDSGTPHAAASLGTRTMVLFGSTSPLWTRPLGDHVDVIQHKVPCSPCFRSECPTQLECFDGITVDDVYAGAVQALRSGFQRQERNGQASL